MANAGETASHRQGPNHNRRPIKCPANQVQVISLYARRSPEQPPEPPPALSKSAAAIWREVFETVKPHQMAGAEFLVEMYATAVSLQRTYALEIEAAKPGERRDELAKYWRAQAATCAMLARQLRLTPRSRVDKRIALKVTPPGKDVPAAPGRTSTSDATRFVSLMSPGSKPRNRARAGSLSGTM